LHQESDLPKDDPGLTEVGARETAAGDDANGDG
jgi:hypothetical protein